MKKQVVASMVGVAMVAASLAGCGGAKSTSTTSAKSTSAAASSSTAAASSAEEVTAASTEAVAATSAAAAADGFLSDADGKAALSGVKAAKEYKFQVVVKSYQSTYWQAALEGMDKAAKDLGVKYDSTGPNSESDIADQINMLNNAVNSAPDGIALAPLDSASCHDALAAAKDAGIPIITFDSDLAESELDLRTAAIVTNGYDAGSIAADHLYEGLKDKLAEAKGKKQVRVGEVNQDATAVNIQQRALGFLDEFIKLATADGYKVAVTGNEYYVNHASDKGDEKSADIILEVAVPAQTTVDLCSAEAQKILSKEDTIAIFGSNQTSAEGVLAANANLNVLGDKVLGVGFDAGATQKAAVESKTLYGAVTQSPYNMGYYSIAGLTAAANGDKVQSFYTSAAWYDASNMKDETVAPDLYD